jgi:DNA-directed RNA polymerase omega subunit
MRDPDLTDVAQRAVKNAGGRFSLVGAIVKRSHQLSVGHPPLVTGVELDKHTTTALREIAAGAVEVCESAPNRTVERDEERAAA